MTYQNQAEYDRAIAAIAGREDIAAFGARILALFPDANRSFTERYAGPNREPLFVFVNDCTRYWTPGTPANYSVYIGINGLSYNGGGSTVEGAIRRANEYFDDFIAEKVSGCIARMCGNDPYGFRAPHRFTNWDD